MLFWILVWWDSPHRSVRFRAPGQVRLAISSYQAAKKIHGEAHWKIEW